MSERKKFNVSSLSELFVLLAIVFLVQTIVNVALEDDAVAVQQLPVTQVAFNQFPSGGDTSDHLRYISIGSIALVFVDGSACDGAAFLGGKPASRMNVTRCMNLPASPSLLLDAVKGDASNIERFSREVLRDYGVQVLILRGEGKLTKISMVFDPKRTRKNLPIHIGMCICALSMDQNGEVIPDSWNIQQKRFRAPHPMVVQIVTYKGGVRRDTALFYSHKSDFRLAGDGRSWPIAEATDRYAFNSPNCAPKGGKLRENYIRDVELIWPNLSRDVRGEI